jgi:hypothetical protein
MERGRALRASKKPDQPCKKPFPIDSMVVIQRRAHGRSHRGSIRTIEKHSIGVVNSYEEWSGRITVKFELCPGLMVLVTGPTDWFGKYEQPV